MDPDNKLPPLMFRQNLLAGGYTNDDIRALRKRLNLAPCIEDHENTDPRSGTELCSRIWSFLSR